MQNFLHKDNHIPYKFQNASFCTQLIRDHRQSCGDLSLRGLQSSPKEVHIDFIQFSHWPRVTDPDPGSCQVCQMVLGVICIINWCFWTEWIFCKLLPGALLKWSPTPRKVNCCPKEMQHPKNAWIPMGSELFCYFAGMKYPQTFQDCEKRF